MKKRVISKILSILIIILCFITFMKVETKATTYNYVDPDSELRGVWVTPITDSALVNYKSESGFKSNMEYIFNVLEEYNMNTLIFHVRQMNDALYDSEINPVYSGWSSVDFDVFDPLAWLIEECHKRGFEFHAWMNPYRVKSYGATTAANVAASFEDYPKNSASNANNLLVYSGKAILNPGLDAVRNHVVDTVLEFVSKYDVDAVHFDDYFYIGMEANGATTGDTTILAEADNQIYIDFCNDFANLDADLKAEYTYYRSSYSATSAAAKADWRRVQCNLFFKQLDAAVAEFNIENNKYVQIGVAPTGIYKNAGVSGDDTVTYDSNGWPITNGSKTGGQTHYSSYLFADTVRWCCMEWIDYIMPQSYWATNHSVAGYYNVMGWWNKVVKNLNVNLYSGIGLYMGEESSNTYNWQTDTDELYTQLEHITTLENVDGASIYNFAHLRKEYDGGTTMSAQQVANLGVNCWKQIVVNPEIKSMTPVNLGKVPHFKVNDNVLTWDKLTGAKFYAIYRSDSELTFSSSELVDVVGGSFTSFEWTDTESGEFNYGIKAISYTNTLGAETIHLNKYQLSNTEGASIRTTGDKQGLKFIFTAQTLEGAVEHGFYLALGNHLTDDFVDAVEANATNINNNKIVNKTISGSGLKFSVVVYDITEEYYNQDISVIAYVKYQDEKTSEYLYEYSEVITRNIAEVAIKAYEAGDTSEFVANIYEKVAPKVTLIGEINIEIYNASLWTAEYYNNYVYLKKGFETPENWLAIYLEDLGDGTYQVLEYKPSGTKIVSITSSDYAIYVYSSNTTDFGTINGLNVQVGDIVTFSTDITALETNQIIDFTATIVRNVE